ncbi:MFS transporter [Georgenia yuyongxinii]|uniref:MFS transporter n=1 Tax=Georgenia yuyongxinii TaxID=2589797 RepID=UPI00143D60BF|nr:MFS transporter [Georgenia yuyongxinii]
MSAQDSSGVAAGPATEPGSATERRATGGRGGERGASNGLATDGARSPHVVRLLMVASVALITLAAFEALAVATVMPVVVDDLGGLHLYAVAAGAPLAAQLVATAASGAWVDARGPRGSLVVGVLAFCVGLVVAGLAPAMGILAVGRAVQGFGAGLLMVPLYVLVGAMVPADRQPRFFAAFAAAWVVPGLVGPAIAGTVADAVSWRWVFLAVPVLTLAAGAVLVPLLRHVPRKRRATQDPAARRATRKILLAATGAGLAAAALQVAGSGGGASGLVLAVAAVAVLAVTVRLLLPGGALRLRRGVPSAVTCRGLLNAAFVSAETFLPLLLVREHGWTVREAGLVLTVSSLTWAGGSAVQGRVHDPRRRALLLWLGPLILVAGTLVAAAASVPGAPAWWVVVGWTIAGAGIGLVFPALSVVVLQSTAPAQHGAVSSSLQISDALGAALGLAAAGALFLAFVAHGALGFLAGLLVSAALAVGALAAGARATAVSAPAPASASGSASAGA